MLKLPYGDQALFFDKKMFELLGRFPDVPFMEDYDLMKKARKFGTIKILNASIITSARRWTRYGMIWNTLLNQV